MATTSVTLDNFVTIPNLDRTPDLLTGKIPGGFDIYWTASVRGFVPRFNVEYSETESGPWCKILADGEETADNFLLGVTPKLGTHEVIRYFRLLIYKHVTTPTVSNTLVWTGDTPQYQAAVPIRGVWLNYREMLRRHRLALEPRYGGQQSALLRRKTYGTKCSRCSDEILKTAQSSTCPICYGTGTEGGYFDAFHLLGQYQEAPPADGNQDERAMGIDEQETSQIKTFAYPLANFKDIWVGYHGSPRYLVKKSSVIEYAGWPVFQILTVSRLPFSDPVYNVPVTGWD